MSVKTLRAELFAELPEAYRSIETPSSWVDANKPGEAVASFLEGPTIAEDGTLHVVDIPYGRIFQVDASGRMSLLTQYDGWPNGMRRHPRGGFAIADYRRGILHLKPGASTPSDLLTTLRSESFKGCNDLIFARDGTLYFTDQGQTGLHDPTGRVYRVSPDGIRVERLIATAPSPNGLVLSLNERVLFVAMTRACEVWRLPLFPEGVSKVGVFARLPAGISGPDGLALDAVGNLYVAHASKGRVFVFDPDGEPIMTVDCRHIGKSVTNLVFGGANNSTLYITVSDSSAIAVVESPYPCAF
ncbi:MAG: SMP-30/gluconolactonase/LRE family protein [Devosia sp.]